MAIDLERPTLPVDNFWQKLMAEIYLDADQLSQIESFREFIQAPDNGFLILDVLDKFIETCSYLSDEEIHQTLKSYVDLAKLLRTHIRMVFFKARSSRHVLQKCKKDNAHLSLDCFIRVVAAHNNIELHSEDVQSFIESKLFRNYKRFAFIKKHPIYVILFLPHVAPSSDEDLIEAAEILQRIKSIALNLLVKLKRELKEGMTKEYEYIYEEEGFCKTISIKLETLHEYLYKGITKSASSHYVDPIINHAFVEAETPFDVIELVSVQMDYAEDIKADFKAILELQKTFPSVRDDLDNFITNFTELRRFFKHFTKRELGEHSDSDEREAQKTRNLKLGIVSVDEFVQFGINSNEVIFDNGLKTKFVELHDIEVDSRTGDSNRETLIVGPSGECKTNSPTVKVMTAKSRNHHLALHNQHLSDFTNPQILKELFDELENQARSALDNEDKQI